MSFNLVHILLRVDDKHRNNEHNVLKFETIGIKENELSNYDNEEKELYFYGKFQDLITVKTEGWYEIKVAFKESPDFQSYHYKLCKKCLIDLDKRCNKFQNL